MNIIFVSKLYYAFVQSTHLQYSVQGMSFLRQPHPPRHPALQPHFIVYFSGMYLSHLSGTSIPPHSFHPNSNGEELCASDSRRLEHNCTTYSHLNRCPLMHRLVGASSAKVLPLTMYWLCLRSSKVSQFAFP